MNDLEITPAETKQRLDRGEFVLLVDVREPWEFEICRIAGAKLIPMGTIPANLQALDTDDEVICYCHHGCAAWTWRFGCAAREWRARNRCPAELIAGR